LIRDKYFLGFIFCILFFIGVHVNANSSILLTLDNGYTKANNSNRSILEFAHTVNDLTVRLYQWADQKVQHKYIGNIYLKTYFLYSLFGNYHLGSLNRLTYHEFGHGSRIIAGGHPISDVKYNVVYGEFDAPKSSKNFVNHYFDLWIEILKNPFINGAQAGTNKINLKVIPNLNKKSWNMLISASGVNNEMFLASSMEDKFYHESESSIFNFPTYLATKLSSYHYAKSELNKNSGDDGGDLLGIIQYFKDEKNINLTLNDFKKYNLIACFLSSTFWEYFMGTKDYFLDNQTTVYQNSWGPIRKPNIAFYINQPGLSYEISSGYRINSKTYIPIKIEYVFLGDTQLEGRIGYSRIFKESFQLSSELRIGKKVGITQSVRYFLSKKIMIQVGYSYYNANNLYGARHIPHISSDLTGDEMWSQIKFVF